MPLPVVTLMHPTLVPRPVQHEGWIYEEKVDGYRMVAYKDGSRVRLISRQGRDHTAKFPEVVHALRRLAVRTLILDGEMAIYDRQLVSRFEWLQHAAPPERATPPLLMVFDCLWAQGKDLRAKTLYARRNVLEEVLAHQDLILPVRRLSDDGQKAWREICERGWEGLVAKDPMAPYTSGRTLRWLKVKQSHYREGERGWEPKGKS